MGLEFTQPTRVWIGREGGWEPVDGVAHVQLQEEALPVEDASVELEFSVKTPSNGVPTCPSGRHPQHTPDTCEEHEELTQAFHGFIELLFAAAFAQAEQAARRYQQALAEAFAGIDTWEPRGLSAWLTEPEQPTPIERALQILAPHLAHEPLYQPNHRWLRAAPAPQPTDEQPDDTGEAAPSTDRPAWQSPYGPPPRRR
jgi:hypothetical protein